ncbi:DinB family protein [Paenibacillus septentrionalis]|uniref:DinB family protein n=1 Tax=Paenibacillus septentrionalis TaxID=429342 RepID=A0ABW1V6N8_9BACL
MSNWIVNQVNFSRNQTLLAASRLTDAESAIIPEGLNNNVKWNLGHIYVVTEKFGFALTGGETNTTEQFLEWFASGTSPRGWTSEPPMLNELISLLQQQLHRISESASNVEQLSRPLTESYTTSTGLHMSTVQESLNFCIYHEAMHFAAIKSIARLVQYANQ